MAYNRANQQKRINYILSIYKAAKEADKPDTFIVRHVFPKYNIFISYRTLMYYKGLKPSEYKQPTLFA